LKTNCHKINKNLNKIERNYPKVKVV